MAARRIVIPVHAKETPLLFLLLGKGEVEGPYPIQAWSVHDFRNERNMNDQTFSALLPITTRVGAEELIEQAINDMINSTSIHYPFYYYPDSNYLIDAFGKEVADNPSKEEMKQYVKDGKYKASYTNMPLRF